MIHLFTNSVGVRKGPNHDPSSPNESLATILSAKTYHAMFSTELLFQLQKANLPQSDVAVLLTGINDCIYRKDPIVQHKVAAKIAAKAQKLGDSLSLSIAQNNLNFIANKSQSDLFQFLNFSQFSQTIDTFLSTHPLTIVVPIIIPPPSSKIIGFAHNELLTSNNILSTNAAAHGSPFPTLPDLFPLTYDHVHLTRLGHQTLAYHVQQAILDVERLKICGK